LTQLGTVFLSNFETGEELFACVSKKQSRTWAVFSITRAVDTSESITFYEYLGRFTKKNQDGDKGTDRKLTHEKPPIKNLVTLSPWIRKVAACLVGTVDSVVYSRQYSTVFIFPRPMIVICIIL
jgi:hypothetical protein